MTMLPPRIVEAFPQVPMAVSYDRTLCVAAKEVLMPKIPGRDTLHALPNNKPLACDDCP